jgi:geranylgeranyl transferase type-2 subunit alpha
MHGRKRETNEQRRERIVKQLPKVLLLRKLQKEIIQSREISSTVVNLEKQEEEEEEGEEDGEKTKDFAMFMNKVDVLTRKLSEIEPEMSTAWNKRKDRFQFLILMNQQRVRERPCVNTFDDDISAKVSERQRELVMEELEASERALRRNMKSYCAWEHRKWVIGNSGLVLVRTTGKYEEEEEEEEEIETDVATTTSTAAAARRRRGENDYDDDCSFRDILEREKRTVEELLIADDRNFHAWKYRTFVCEMLGDYDCDDEQKYAREKISKNFSNYSAWHHRSVHFKKLNDDDNNSDSDEKKQQQLEEFQSLLDDEFELVSQAFFTEPEDQSAWMYHKWLLSKVIDSKKIEQSYKVFALKRELSRCEEISAIEPLCKWPVLVSARIHFEMISLTSSRDDDDDYDDDDDCDIASTNTKNAEEKEEQQQRKRKRNLHHNKAIELFQSLLSLDPLRKGYYLDILKACAK